MKKGNNPQNFKMRRDESAGYEKTVKRKAAVMVADIRNFTTISDGMNASDIVDVLNLYMDVVEACVNKTNGVVGNIMGDSVIAFWEDERTDGRAALLAVQCAVEIQRATGEVDEEVFEKYGKEFSFGIGINFGETIIGKLGSSSRRSAMVLGDTVNMAAKLEKISAMGNICISSVVRQMLGDKIDVTELKDRYISRHTTSAQTVYILNGITEDKQLLDEPLSTLRKKKEKYALHIMGCRGSYHISGKRFNEFGGQTTCSILKVGKHAIVFDCGTGLYKAQGLLADCTRVDVVLSHVHYDHCLGLLDWSVFPKGVELNFYGNFRSWLGLRTINELFATPFWPVDPFKGEVHQIPDWGKMLYLGDDVTIRFYPSNHPNGATVFHIMVADKSIVMMVDCERADAMPIDVVRGCDLLIFDGMYDNNEYESRIGWGHSTWQEGCKLAVQADVKQLIISHHSPNRGDADLRELEEYARNIFPNTTFARAGMVIRL